MTTFKSNLSNFLKREELSNPSVYFLVGEDEENIYDISETENFNKQVKHHRDKEFWNQYAVFTSKDNSFNKAYVK